MLIDLSHPILPGQLTHPGLPAPVWEPFRSREQYREASGTEFQVDRVCMVGNTGTYLDSPYHRFAAGGDLASLPLTAVADLPIVIVDARRGGRAVTADRLRAALADEQLRGTAVLLYTGGADRWGTNAYAVQAPFLSADGAQWLAERAPALVGIDSVNIDDLEDTNRPAHTCLLAEAILILEHLTQLGSVP